MNTRIQVEHPVTEMITGVDLVRCSSSLRAATISPASARAGSCRAATPSKSASMPRTRRRTSCRRRAARRAAFPCRRRDIRVDTGFDEGDEITPHYDPMIAKLIVRGEDRADAIARGRRGLGATHIDGPATNLALLRAVLDHPAFIEGRTFTNFLDIHRQELLAPA